MLHYNSPLVKIIKVAAFSFAQPYGIEKESVENIIDSFLFRRQREQKGIEENTIDIDCEIIESKINNNKQTKKKDGRISKPIKKIR